MAEDKNPAPPKMVKVKLKKDHTHKGVLYKLEEGKPAPEIEVTEGQQAWLKERGII